MGRESTCSYGRSRPGADILVAMDHGVRIGHIQPDTGPGYTDSLTVGIFGILQLDFLSVDKQFPDRETGILPIVLELEADGFRGHGFGVEGIHRHGHSKRIVQIVLLLFEVKESAAEPDTVSKGQTIVIITGIESQVLHHTGHHGRALQDKDLVVYSLGHASSGELAEQGHIGVGTIVFIEHDPRRALILGRLHPDINGCDDQANECRKDNPPFKTENKFQYLPEIDGGFLLLLNAVGTILLIHV